MKCVAVQHSRQPTEQNTQPKKCHLSALKNSPFIGKFQISLVGKGGKKYVGKNG